MAKRTVFQRLNTIFGPEGVRQNQITSNKYSMSNDILLKTQSKEEYDSVKLQNQQNKYLRNVWKKVDGELFQQSIHYETTRIGSYTDFESMEFYPEISATLDVIMEEATTTNNFGKILNVYSDSNRIKGVLEDLFFNRLDIHVSLPMWVRNLAKYGDNFILLNLDNSKGVLGARQLPNFEIERREGDILDAMISARNRINVENVSDESSKVKFFWRGRDVEFNSWQIGHFRLLGDDRRLPYGVSVLEKARRVWKQLCVSENTEVWTDNGYKKIKDLTPGEIIYSYDYDNGELVKTPIKDCWQSGIKKTYNIRTRYNSIDVTDDHQVLVYNGSEFSYKRIDEIKPSYDRLVTPTIDSNLKTKTIKLNSDDYYIKLNESGLEKSNNLGRVGVVKKLKSIDEKNYKNIHRFIQGNGKVIYKHINQLCEVFGFTKDDFDLYYHNTKSILNIDLEYTIDESFIRFFGFMLGDGWLCKNGIGFALGIDGELNDFYIDYVKEHLKEKVVLTTSKHSEYSKSIIISNKEIKNILINLGFITGFGNKRIPSWVYKMGKSFKRKLIKGLFDADGSDKYGVIGLANKGLITDLKQLTLQSGIACGKIGEKEGSTKFNEKTGKYETRQDSYKLYINFNNIVDDVRYEKIIDVTENDVEPVWDLEVESNLHNFIANGSVVHNCLAEDAMLVYRLTRAPERRIYKIFVGNIDEEDVPSYVDEIANRFKRTPIIDPKTGQIDVRYNTMPVWKNTPIPLLDGRTITIEELAKEYNNGKENWVYSIQDDTHQVVGGKVAWCGKNYTADRMVKVWLDDDTYIVTAEEHPFVMRDGTKKRADELKENDSLMPFYRDTKGFNDKPNSSKYERVYNPNSGKYEFTHRLVNNKVDTLVIDNIININEFNITEEYADTLQLNHKVKSIEFIGGDDVYCMTVLGKNGEDDRHNFAVLSFKSDGEISVSGSFLGNSNDQDFFIPVRDENAPSPIDTLPGACIALDTRIPLLDGRTLELQEIIEEWNSGNRDLWVYSCNPETGELAPGMITWAGETRKNTEVIKITLDNGESLITTPDHKWVHRTKGFVEAKDLIVGDSLMPFYRDEEYILNKKYSKKYERVWDSSKQEWIYTHRMVSWFMKENNNEQYHIFEGSYEKNNMKTIHHMDNNRFNNNPKNLFFMDSKDHYRYHRHELWSTPEKHNITIEKISKGLNRYISNLTEEEKQLRGNQSKLNSINSRDKANETFKNNLNRTEVIKNRGEKISIAKSTEEFKEKFSEIAKTNWQSEEYRNKVFSKKQNLIFSDELYSMFFEMFKLTGRADLTLNELNHSNDFMNEFINSNKDIRSSLTNLNEFTHKHLEKMLKEKGFKNYREWCKVIAEELGYKNVRAWRYFIEKDKNSSEFYNHKITSIEWLENKIDTGTITVDGDEIYHNYHTFATESGVFIKNSNLDQIADIQYLQRKLFTALRVPKQFLNFDEPQGEGKNLSLQDVRFSRTINRIQQAVLAELNKIAIIHLVLLGFEDDLDNFTLTMNNPSTQAEMMKIEQMQMKVTLFKDAVSDSGNGFSPMSMTRAHREILGWSDDEIKQDLLEQRIEKAAAAEMENTSNVIKYTGMFDKVDSIYGDIEAAKAGGTPSEGGDEEGGGGPTGGGGGSFGGGGLEFGGDEGGDEVPEEGAGETPEPETGGEAPEAGSETPEAVPPLAESVNKKKVITERVLSGKVKKPINKKVYSNSFDNLMDSIKNKDEDKVLNERVKVYDKSLKINEDINNIINNIDKMLDE